jgi:hypothetical protein
MSLHPPHAVAMRSSPANGDRSGLLQCAVAMNERQSVVLIASLVGGLVFKASLWECDLHVADIGTSAGHFGSLSASDQRRQSSTAVITST